MKQFIVATAGHVDHGKSALVKALTGIDPDRLPEEKARGITIDLGFAHLELPTPSDASDRTTGLQDQSIHLGIVDVPGHEDFVKNMVAGVGSIDLALLVVAADDGWMPQTEEHLQILTYLGVQHGVVALTKIDLAANNESSVVASLREKLADSPLADSPIVSTSVLSGRGLAELKQTLALVLSAMPAPRDIGKPRLPVDRVFTLRGIGTVVTGTLSGGCLKRGQSLVVQPAGTAARVRSIQTHSREVESSGPGTRTALNLPDISAPGKGHSAEALGVRRGDVITLAELGPASKTLNVLLTKSARLAGSKTRAARPLKDGALIHFHHGSGNWPGRVSLLDRKEIGPGEQAIAQIRFESPVFTFMGDRFIVRDWAEQATLGGGVVLDPDASRPNFRKPAQKRFVERLAERWHDAALCLEAQLQRDGASFRSTLLLKSGFSALEIQQALAELTAAGKVFLNGDLAADKPWWEKLRQQAAAEIAAEHRAHPERAGLSLNQLRSVLEKQLPLPEAFEAIVAELCQSGFVQTGAAIREASHRPALPEQLRVPGAKVRAALAARPLEPPSRKELAADPLSQQVLRFLLQTGEAVELGEEVVLLTENFNGAVSAIKKFLREHGAATVSDLRQALGTSRRIMVPLLERLDREGITVRQGDKRILKKT